MDNKKKVHELGGGWMALMKNGWRVEGFDGEWMEGVGF